MTPFDTGGIVTANINGFNFRFVRALGHKGILLDADQIDELSNPQFILALQIAQHHQRVFQTLSNLLEAATAPHLHRVEVDILYLWSDQIPVMLSQQIWPLSFDDRHTLELFHMELSREIKKREQPIPKLKMIEGYVYVLKSPTGAYKIGKTKHPKDRLRTFHVKLPFEVEYACLIPTQNMNDLEHQLHIKYKDKRINGEWFNLSDDDLDDLKGLAI